MNETLDNIDQATNMVAGWNSEMLLSFAINAIVWIAIVCGIIFVVNKILLPICDIEIEIKGHKFGSHWIWDFFKNRKVKKENREASNARDRASHTKAFYDMMMKSAKTLATRIDQEAIDRYDDLSRETKSRLNGFIHRLLGMYRTEVEESSRSSEKEKEEYLRNESIEYFKNLLYLASYKDELVDQVVSTINKLLELDELNGNTQDKEKLSKQLTSSFTNALMNPFVENRFFKDKVDSHSVEAVIVKQAQKEVEQIWENLKETFSERKSTYTDRVDSWLETFKNQVKEAGEDESKKNE